MDLIARTARPHARFTEDRGEHGELVKTVQSRLGHARAVETPYTYAHLWPDSDDRTREAIDSVLGAPADCLRTERPG